MQRNGEVPLEAQSRQRRLLGNSINPTISKVSAALLNLSILQLAGKKGFLLLLFLSCVMSMGNSFLTSPPPRDLCLPLKASFERAECAIGWCCDMKTILIYPSSTVANTNFSPTKSRKSVFTHTYLEISLSTKVKFLLMHDQRGFESATHFLPRFLWGIRRLICRISKKQNF
jgi:hypothetical protein